MGRVEPGSGAVDIFQVAMLAWFQPMAMQIQTLATWRFICHCLAW